MTRRGYEQDFYAWLLTQAAHIRAKAWEALDIDNVAEELDGMARHERHTMSSFLRQLLIYLLKWAYQTERRSRSWRGSITLARQHIEERLEESPSLRPELPQFLARAYPRAALSSRSNWPDRGNVSRYMSVEPRAAPGSRLLPRDEGRRRAMRLLTAPRWGRRERP